MKEKYKIIFDDNELRPLAVKFFADELTKMIFGSPKKNIIYGAPSYKHPAAREIARAMNIPSHEWEKQYRALLYILKIHAKRIYVKD